MNYQDIQPLIDAVILDSQYYTCVVHMNLTEDGRHIVGSFHDDNGQSEYQAEAYEFMTEYNNVRHEHDSDVDAFWATMNDHFKVD